MNVVVNIPKSTIDKCTESAITSPLAKFTTPISPLVGKVNCCRGFVTKALEFLIEFNKPVGNIHQVEQDGKHLTYITIKNVKETAHFFETFKRLGINIGTLVIGSTDDYSTIYMPEKIVKDLKKHTGTETLSAMAMYIITLAQFCKGLYMKSTKYMVDKYDRTVEIDTFFADMMYSFLDNEYVVDIRGITSDAYDLIGWYYGPYTSYEYTASTGLEFKYNIVKTDTGFETIILEHSMGSFTTYYQIYSDGTVNTNADLCYFELQSDSLTRAVLPRYSKSAMITAHSITGTTFTAIDIDDATDATKAIVAELMSRVTLNEGLTKSTFKAFGVDIKGSAIAVDPDVIRESYADDTYAQQLYEQVQDYYDTFELGNLTNTVPGFAKGDIYAMLFTGSSGTGKSTSARVIPYKCGIPYISVNFSVNIEESDLFGSMIPNPTKKDASEPEFIWQDGIITKAIRNGYCAILEEINFARPGVLGKLNSLLDENRQIDLPTGEIVKAHKNFRMIATCNIAYEGTNRLNKAFINRFEQIVNFENPTTDKLIEIIKTRTGYAKNDNIVKILDVYNAVHKFSTEQNLDLVVSVRQLLTIFRQGKYYKSAQEAVENIIVNGAFIEVPEYMDLFKKSVLTAFDLKFKI